MKILTASRPYVLVLLMLGFYYRGSTAQDSLSILERGQKASENDQWRKALTIWGTARDSAQDPQTIDPRIGLKYIALAARHQMLNFYEHATEMYLWALSGRNLDQFEEVYDNEIQRLKPLISNKKYKKWRRALKDRDPMFLEEMQAFWFKMDPTPDSKQNERLLEHWERIAYAKEHFTRNNSTVYGTDDRGPIYIKYGKPDRVKEGLFSYNRFQVEDWARSITSLNPPAVPSSSGANNFMSSGGESTMSPSERVQNQMNKMFMENYTVKWLTKYAQLYHSFPSYEIWVYKQMDEQTNENVVYIFGEPGEAGRFGIRKSLEEMIPRQAFRKTPRFVGNSPATPGLLLQLMLYEDASIADEYFARAFHNLESRIFNLNGFSPSISFEARSHNESNLFRLQSQAPDEVSTYRENLPEIKIEQKQYRLLNEHNQPYLATFVYSKPQKVYMFNTMAHPNKPRSDFKLTHMFQIRNKNWRVVTEGMDAPNVYMGEDLDHSIPSQSLFFIPDISPDFHQIITAKFTGPNTGERHGIFPGELKALGKLQTNQPVPLDNDLSKIQMGDVILGFGKIGETSKKYPFPFVVSPANEIPEKQNMVIHFEVYHLKFNADDKNHFILDYKVLPINWLGRAKRRAEKVSLTLNFESNHSYYKEDLEVETKDFEPGKYELRLKATDFETGQEIKQNIRFKVVENRKQVTD